MNFNDFPQFKAVVKRKWKISLILTCIMLFVYFGFILLIAFDKPYLAKLIGKNITLGLPIGIGILIFAWILTGIYTYWANNFYDKQINELKKKMI